MGRLAQIQQQINARRSALQSEKQAEREQEALERQLLEQVARAVDKGFSKVDLNPVLQAIAAIPEPPEPPETDLSPVFTKIDTVAQQVRQCMDMLKAEGRATRNSMPKMPDKVDLSQVLADLQWLKTVIALDQKKDVEEEEIQKKWFFTIERDHNGFIKSIRAE